MAGVEGEDGVGLEDTASAEQHMRIAPGRMAVLDQNAEYGEEAIEKERGGRYCNQTSILGLQHAQSHNPEGWGPGHTEAHGFAANYSGKVAVDAG